MVSPEDIIFGIENLEPGHIQGKRILEVGSQDVNGGLRKIVMRNNPAEYIGIDIEDGKGVDLLLSYEDLIDKFGEDSFDLVITTSTLEHVANWKEFLDTITMVCKPEGHILLSVPRSGCYHGYPHDYWRFSKYDLLEVFKAQEIIVSEEHRDMSMIYLKKIDNQLNLTITPTTVNTKKNKLIYLIKYMIRGQSK